MDAVVLTKQLRRGRRPGFRFQVYSASICDLALSGCEAVLLATFFAKVAISKPFYLTTKFGAAKVVRALKLFIGVTLVAGWAVAVPATAQEPSRIARCVAIQDINERIDCLEGRNDPDPSAQNPNRPRPSQAGPSYDCRMATTSIERAICGDLTLAEWDLRMGQQYQQALRLRKGPDSQALIANQRSWIQQRNAVCGGVAGTAVWSCVLDMTKQRIAALSEAPPASVDPTPVASTSPFPQPRVQNAPPVVVPPVAQRGPDVATASKPTAAPQSSSGINPLLVGIFIVGAVIGGIVVFNNIRRREEERRRAAERQRLVDKYGDEIADRILARMIWQGMTEEQLLESWGGPADKDREIRKATTKETWKYGQTGRNRFSNRVFLENGVVIGWKQ